jgi:hypothetical protein
VAKDTAAIPTPGKPVCLVHLTLPRCFLNSKCSASCMLAVVDRWEEAALTEEVGTTPAGPGQQPSQYPIRPEQIAYLARRVASHLWRAQAKDLPWRRKLVVAKVVARRVAGIIGTTAFALP